MRDNIKYKGFMISFENGVYECKGVKYNSLKFLKDLIDFKII